MTNDNWLDNLLSTDSDCENQEFFTLRNNKIIFDENLSDKLRLIKTFHPEKTNDNGSGFEWGHIGMAELFSEIYNTETRYCPEHKSWYTYHEGVWKKDIGSLLLHRKIKQFTRLMLIYCGEITDDDIRKRYATFINKLIDRRVREQIAKDCEEFLIINAFKFDTNPYLINCQNGTYDLRSYTFEKPKWNDFITMQTNFKHTINRSVKCDRWESFIDEITEGDKNKASYLQKALGYSLIGHNKENCIFMLYGKSTRNGKSTLVDTVMSMLGDYGRVSPIGLLIKGKYYQNPENASPELVELKGKRFVTMAEPGDEVRLDEEKIKQFTGGEPLTGRGLRQSPVTFVPQFKIWITCNFLPEIKDLTVFASDRIRVIELNRHFSREEQDPSLSEYFKTQEARTGIFMWLIRGYIRYKTEGLVMPKSMRKVVRKYEKDSDFVLMFLENKCERTPDNTRIKARDLYVAFVSWAKSEGVTPISARKFNVEMERHSNWYAKKTFKDGYQVYKGIGLKNVLEKIINNRIKV